MRTFALSGVLLVSGMQVAAADPVRDFVVAVQIDNATQITKLLKTMSPNTVDPITGETGLILALREESHRVFDVLVAHPDIQLELQAPNSNTALMMAAFKRNLPAVRTLLAKGAAVNRPGWTALHYAAVGGDEGIVALLLERGAQVDALAPARMTPLMLAAREGQEAAAAALLGAGADTALTNSEGLNAAEIARRADKPRIAAAIEARPAQAKGVAK